MEYVMVKYKTNRVVFMDGKELGSTNESLMVEQGTHGFDLGQPSDYAPKSRTVKVVDTSPLIPMEILFDPV